jgi:hypothetical protein
MSKAKKISGRISEDSLNVGISSIIFPKMSGIKVLVSVTRVIPTITDTIRNFCLNR